MNESEAIIERVWQVDRGIQRIDLTVDASLQNIGAGQFLLAMPQQLRNHYLRDLWIPVKQEDGIVTVERTTREHHSPGQLVSLIGPIGEPYPWLSGGNRHLLLIAKDTPPTPLLMLASEAIRHAAEVAMILLGSALEYSFAGIPAAVEVINGEEDRSWSDDPQIFTWADQVFVAADRIMWLETFSSLFHLIREARAGAIPVNFLYGVPMMPLPCGTGACDACMVRCKNTMKHLCVQGPALDLAEVQLL